MNRTQRALTALLFAASFMVSGVASAQMSDSSDSASAVRGSLGVSLESLSFSNNFGKLVFLLNGGFALLSGALVCSAVAKHRREPIRDHDHFGDLRSENSVMSI